MQTLQISIYVLAFLVALALIFDFMNGFHDAANAIATVVATRVLTPFQALAMAGTLNLAGALAGTAVAVTVAKGIVDSTKVTQDLVLAALVAAIAWDLITFYAALPTSSSHALIFGMIGASVSVHGWGVVVVPGLEKTSAAIVVSPTTTFVVGYLLMLALYWILKDVSYTFVNRFFGKAQIVSSAWMAFTHGGNDGQKTMGIISLALFSYGTLGREFYIPTWVAVAAALAIGLGVAKLVLLTDVEGLYADWDGRAGVLLSELSAADLRALVPSLSGGMVPKMRACLAAVDGGVPAAHLLDGRVAHALLLEVFTDSGVGTMVTA